MKRSVSFFLQLGVGICVRAEVSEVDIFVDKGENCVFLFSLVPSVENIFYLMQFFFDFLLTFVEHFGQAMAPVHPLLVVRFQVALLWEGNQTEAQHDRNQRQTEQVHNGGEN